MVSPTKTQAYIIAEVIQMQELRIGNTIIKIDTSYVDTRTAEQAKVDEAMLTDAVWALYDELEEAV